MPGVIGSLLIASTNRSFGSSVSTLLGMRFSGLAAGSAIKSGLAAAYVEVKRRGVLTRAAPIRPIQFEASSLPRWGVEINYHSLNVRSTIKDQCLFQELACVARQRSFGRRRGKKIAPDFVACIC